jgi:ATP-binding cassette subfamily F protein 3
MERLSTKVLYLEDGVHKLYYGDYAYFLEKTQNIKDSVPTGLRPVAVTNNPTEKSPIVSSNNVNSNNVNSKLFREEQKKLSIETRRRAKIENSLIEKIEKLEKDKAVLMEEISKPENYSNGEKAKELQKKIRETDAQIEQATADWAATAN